MMEKELEMLAHAADNHYKEGNFKAVEEEYGNLINNLNKHQHTNILALAYNNKGHAKYMQVNFPGAKQDYDAALNLNPKLAVVYYNRATVVFRMGWYEEALPDFQAAVSLDKTNPEFEQGLQHCLAMVPQGAKK